MAPTLRYLYLGGHMKYKILISFMILAFVTSCNNKNTNRGINTRLNEVGGVLNTGLTCTNGTSNVGTIYDSNGGFGMNGTASFEDRVKALLSATINPSEIGMISAGQSDPTGVRFQGVIKIDSNGQVNLASTNIKILVYDSYVLNSQYATDGKKYEAIPIEFTAATSGNFDSTGSGYVLFKDTYGEIRFDGKYDQQYFQGTVSFKNTQSVLGGTAAQGTLGQFYVARCGIIQ